MTKDENIKYKDFMKTPRYEADVLHLFREIALWRFGIRIDATRPNVSPDIVATKGRRKITIEIELNSKAYKRHVRKGQRADLVVCWKNDWQQCPEEVWELSSLPLTGEVSRNEDDFYFFANRFLLDGRRSDMLYFNASTPILFLSRETYTPYRTEYKERLFSRMNLKSGRLRGRYMFGLNTTLKEVCKIEHTKFFQDLQRSKTLLSQGNIDAHANNRRIINSCLLGATRGVELLKNHQGKVIVVEFLEGERLQNRRIVFQELWKETLPQRKWENQLVRSAGRQAFA